MSNTFTGQCTEAYLFAPEEKLHRYLGTTDSSHALVNIGTKTEVSNLLQNVSVTLLSRIAHKLVVEWNNLCLIRRTSTQWNAINVNPHLQAMLTMSNTFSPWLKRKHPINQTAKLSSNLKRKWYICWLWPVSLWLWINGGTSAPHNCFNFSFLWWKRSMQRKSQTSDKQEWYT